MPRVAPPAHRHFLEVIENDQQPFHRGEPAQQQFARVRRWASSTGSGARVSAGSSKRRSSVVAGVVVTVVISDQRAITPMRCTGRPRAWALFHRWAAGPGYGPGGCAFRSGAWPAGGRCAVPKSSLRRESIMAPQIADWA